MDSLTASTYVNWKIHKNWELGIENFVKLCGEQLIYTKTSLENERIPQFGLLFLMKKI